MPETDCVSSSFKDRQRFFVQRDWDVTVLGPRRDLGSTNGSWILGRGRICAQNVEMEALHSQLGISSDAEVTASACGHLHVGRNDIPVSLESGESGGLVRRRRDFSRGGPVDMARRH